MTKYIFFRLLYFAERYIFNVLGSEAGAPTHSGPVAFYHPDHPIVMPLQRP
jgi:hypothetical protein